MNDYEEEVAQVVEIQPMVVNPGWVAIPYEDFQVREAMLQRMVILIERIEAGEKLSKEQLLRALGRFDSAIAEMLETRFGGEKT